MALDAGSVYATLGGRFNPAGFVAFDRAMVNAGSRMSRFSSDSEKSASRTSRALHAMGGAAVKGAAVGIAGLGVAIGYSIKKAADFEAQLDSLQAVTQASGRQMAALKKQALDAGAATKYSALEAAAAQTELAKGGLSVHQILSGGLKGSLALAAAGEMDLADAAATTVNAMKLFGLSGDQAIHVADALATAANSTTADVSDFAMALTQGGSAAKLAGFNFNETVAALEALAEIGVKNSDAGTSLKSFFLQIGNPSKKAKAAMDELGLSIFDTQGKLKSLPAISDNLRQSFGKLTKEQFLQKAGTIAGSDAIRALYSLYSAGPEKLKRLEVGLQRQGTAAEVAAAKQDNLKGKIENLKGSIETAAIKVGEVFIPYLVEGAEALTDFINRASQSGDLERFAQGLITGGQEAIDIIGAIVETIGDFGPVAGAAFHSVQFLVNALGGIEPAAHAITGAVVAIGALRVAQAVYPAIEGLATAISLVSTAARSGELAALPGLFGMAMSPAGALTIGIGVLGAAFGLLSSREDAEAEAAKRSADAKRDQAQAHEDLEQAVLDAADAQLAAERARRNHSSAQRELNKLKHDEHTTNKELAESRLRVKETGVAEAQANKRAADALKQKAQDSADEITSSHRRVAATKDEIDAAQERLIKLKAGFGTDEQIADQQQKLTRLRHEHEQAIRDESRAVDHAAISEVNYQRLLQGLQPIAAKNRSKIADLVDAMKGVPKDVQTKILMQDQPALVKLAGLVGRLRVFEGDDAVKRIIAQAPNFDAMISRLRAELASLHDKTVTITTVRRLVNQIVGGAGGLANQIIHASGRGPGQTEDAVIGEGGGPEYRIDAASGQGYKTGGAHAARLRSTEYVVPTEPRYRGRGIELWMALGHDLGVAGYAGGRGSAQGAFQGKGRKGKNALRYVPTMRESLRFPLDKLEEELQDAQTHHDDAKRKLQDAQENLKQQQHDAKLKGDANKHTRKVARDNLPGAKTKVNNAKADEKSAYAALVKARGILGPARKHAAATGREEDQVEIWRQRMELADEKDDQKAYDKAKRQYLKHLRKERRRLQFAQGQARKGGPYWRELEKQIGQLNLDLRSGKGSASEAEQEAADEKEQAAKDAADDAESAAKDAADHAKAVATGEELSDADQAELDAIERDLALAELTDTIEGPGEDTDVLTRLVGFRERVLEGLRGSPTATSSAIADAARNVKSARDQLTSLTEDAAKATSPDLEAQLAQANARTAAAEKSALLSEAFVRAGSGGDVNIYTLHPGDPATLDAIASASNSGNQNRPAATSPRELVGL